MMTISRRTKAVAAFIIIVIVGYFVAKFWQGQSNVPADFTAARTQGSAIAATIVDTSNKSTSDLQKVNEFDQEGDYSDALTLTKNLITQSDSLRNQAVDLSTQVGNMTKALSGVNSTDAQQAALESIASRLALINQLITYSSDLMRLSNVLQAHFEGQPQTKGEVQGLVNQINTDVNAINNFNLQATQAMNSFDKLVGK